MNLWYFDQALLHPFCTTLGLGLRGLGVGVKGFQGLWGLGFGIDGFRGLGFGVRSLGCPVYSLGPRSEGLRRLVA